MADAVDSKSTARKGIGVQVPSPAPAKTATLTRFLLLDQPQDLVACRETLSLPIGLEGGATRRRVNNVIAGVCRSMRRRSQG